MFEVVKDIGYGIGFILLTLLGMVVFGGLTFGLGFAILAPFVGVTLATAWGLPTGVGIVAVLGLAYAVGYDMRRN